MDVSSRHLAAAVPRGYLVFRQTSNSKPTLAQAPAAYDISRLFDHPNTIIVALVAFILGSATVFGTSSIYQRYFMSLASAEWISPNILRRRPWITGVVTRPGDNFRLYHTPCFGWRGPLKFRHIPERSRELVRNTIHIRTAGSWRASTLSNVQISVCRHRRTPTRRSHGSKSTSTADDSNASVTNTGGSSLRRWWPRHSATPSLSLEMVRAGWGVVNTGAGAEPRYSKRSMCRFFVFGWRGGSTRNGIVLRKRRRVKKS
ncbi:hypothetical protein V8E53_000522 [Lactarius tabidus]